MTSRKYNERLNLGSCKANTRFSNVRTELNPHGKLITNYQVIWMDSVPSLPKKHLEIFVSIREVHRFERSLPCPVAASSDHGPVSEVVLVDLHIAILGVLVRSINVIS